MTVPARLAVFDVDGTLIDSQHNIVAAMTLAFRAHRLDDPRPEAVRRIIGLSLVEAVARLLPDQDGDCHVRVAHSYKDAFMDLRSRREHSELLFPGAAVALATLAERGWLLGVATGKSRRGLDAMIERHGFQGMFVTRQTADDHPGKPHPGMLLRALEETGVEANGAVMVGDTTYDILMGRNARVHAAGVSWGYHAPEELVAAGAEIMIDNYGELPASVGRLVEDAVCVLAPF